MHTHTLATQTRKKARSMVTNNNNNNNIKKEAGAFLDSPCGAVKNKKKTMLFKDSSREKRCWGLSFSIYKYTHKWRTYAKASYRQVVE